MNYKNLFAVLAFVAFAAGVNAAPVVDTFTSAPLGGITGDAGWTSPETGLNYARIAPPAAGHLHFIGGGQPTSPHLEYENDTGGFAITSATAFDLLSWDLFQNGFKFDSPTNLAHDLIVDGFSTILANPADTGAVADATQTFAFNTTGTGLTFNAAFTGLKMVRVYFADSLGKLPEGTGGPGSFSANYMQFDNVTIEASAVPVPAAVYLFGSALVGLIGLGRRNISLT